MIDGKQYSPEGRTTRVEGVHGGRARHLVKGKEIIDVTVGCRDYEKSDIACQRTEADRFRSPGVGGVPEKAAGRAQLLGVSRRPIDK